MNTRACTWEGQRRVEWRATLDFPIEVLCREARSADLVIIAREKVAGSACRALDPGGAILKMGRPTLVVPEGGLLDIELT